MDQTSPLPAGVDRVIELPSGKTATIYQGKGRDVRKAQKLAESDQSLYMNALMSLLVQIDGQYLLMEDFDDLDAKDYMKLLSEVTENFM